jgi:hypothetical protein
MTTTQRAQFAADLEAWVLANPNFTLSALTDWINAKLRELKLWLASQLLFEFVWESLTNGNGSLAQKTVAASQFPSGWVTPGQSE